MVYFIGCVCGNVVFCHVNWFKSKYKLEQMKSYYGVGV